MRGLDPRIHRAACTMDPRIKSAGTQAGFRGDDTGAAYLIRTSRSERCSAASRSVLTSRSSLLPMRLRALA